jgi:plasmid stability protein
MNEYHGRRAMAILQIKGIDDSFYARLKEVAAEESRSVSQEVLHITKEYMARRDAENADIMSAKVLLALAGSWEDERNPEEIAADIKAGRRDSRRTPTL